MADVDELFDCFNEEADEIAHEPPVALTEGPVVKTDNEEKDTPRYVLQI